MYGEVALHPAAARVPFLRPKVTGSSGPRPCSSTATAAARTVASGSESLHPNLRCKTAGRELQPWNESL